MYGSTKMSAVMNEWILARTANHVMNQSNVSLKGVTYSHFLGVWWSALWWWSGELLVEGKSFLLAMVISERKTHQIADIL